MNVGIVPGSKVPCIETEVLSQAGVRDHSVKVIRPIMVWPSSGGFEWLYGEMCKRTMGGIYGFYLIAVSPYLCLPSGCEIGFDGLASACEVTDEDLERGELSKVERSVIT